jgi:hypothetical protein
MRYVTFKTDLFFTEIPDDQLDSWFLGGDCAGWFYARLLPVPEVRPDLDPTMEDWGWIIAVKVQELVVDVSVWEYLDQEKSWVLGIGAKTRWLKRSSPQELRSAEELVCSAIEKVLTSDSRFSDIRWSEEHPGA